MGTRTDRIYSTFPLAKITSVLGAAFLVVSFDGCVPETGGPSPPPTGAPPPSAISNAAQPITVELTQTGEPVKITDARGVPLPKPTRPAGRERQYQVGSGMMASPTKRSVTIPARCFREYGQNWQCTPSNTSAQIQLDRQELRNVTYSLNGKSFNAGPPVGAPPVPMAAYFSFCSPNYEQNVCQCGSFDGGYTYPLPC
jgi:hypothetical protein